VLADLDPRDQAAVHLVGAVGEPERPRVGPHRRQREVVGHAAATVHLHREVDHLLGDVGDDHLDLAGGRVRPSP